MTKLEESMLKKGDIIVKDNKEFMFFRWVNIEGLNHSDFMNNKKRLAIVLDVNLIEIKTELLNYK